MKLKGAPAATVPRSASDLVATLVDRAPRLALAIAAGQFAWPTAQALREKARERTTYRVKIPATDEIYDDLHEWVLSLLPPKEQRALVAWTSKRGGELMEISDERRPPQLHLRHDGAHEQNIMVRGHKITVVVSEDEASVKETGRLKPPELVFTASSQEGQQQLLQEIKQLAASTVDRNRRPLFRMLNRWDDWERLDNLPVRTLDSVILRKGQLERLIADVEKFLGGEQDYLRRCIPWHRCHLYEGPPGTGKTSVARAIASHFGMDIWYLPLADVKKDGDLLRVTNRISPRSMLLLEDADVFHAATARDDTADLTLSGLLNTLDGIATPHGLFTVLTTNTPEVLDHAVVRPGRVDLVEHFGATDTDQVARLLARWYGQPVPTGGISGLSPAQVIEVCKRHDDPIDAIADLAYSMSEMLK